MGYHGDPTAPVDHVLVLAGEVRAGGLLVKAAWRSDSDRPGDDPLWSPALEAALLVGLDAFRQSDAVPPALAKSLTRPPGFDRKQRTMKKVAAVPPGPRRLPRLAVRYTFYAAYFAALGYVMYRYIEDDWVWICLVPVFISVLFVLPAFLLFARFEARRLFSAEPRKRAACAGAPDRPARCVVVGGGATGCLDSPSVRKHAADLEAAGFAHAGDWVRAPTDEPGAVRRVFRAPDGATYLSLVCRSRGVWPVAVEVQVQTFFPDGWRVESSNAPADGFWWGRTTAAHVFRVLPDVAGPLELFAAHAAEVARAAATANQTPAPHERFEQFIGRQEAIHEEERRQWALHPYSWSDHLRWYVDRPRKEYRR
ncbi:hypothetical protein FTUN_4668 [Frigoriglobus tundricola]|uniref:Uncharacterized protein n=2 Tax=Frigoriglobus tundricola TaxID=2774151 RepID=A0A6M5YV38_9BACT|nr:hypothetical protein FTUN_4668 [Frigoriglobus tundricola]